jgi:hypothetical protein
VSNQGWTPVPAFAQIDEVTADDGDFVQSPPAPNNAVLEVGLTPGSDPLLSTGHVVTYRIRKNQPGGAQINITVSLMQGATTIASWTHTNLGSEWQTFTQTLTGSQADTITDYAGLSLRASAAQV